MDTLPDWYTSIVAKLVEHGFFESGSIDGLADKIVRESAGSYFGSILALKDDPLFTQILTSYDKSRVWFVEDYTVLGAQSDYRGQFYESVFDRLRTISQGVFEVDRINVQQCGFCPGRDKRLTVDFWLNGARREVTFCADADVLVLGFLEELNELLRSTGTSFQAIMDPYGACFVYFLTDTQREWLQTALLWAFGEHQLYWLEKAQFLRDANRPEEAHACFAKAIRNGYQPFVVSEFAQFLLEQGENQKAVEVYERGISALEADRTMDFRQWWLATLRTSASRARLACGS